MEKLFYGASPALTCRIQYFIPSGRVRPDLIFQCIAGECLRRGEHFIPLRGLDRFTADGLSPSAQTIHLDFYKTIWKIESNRSLSKGAFMKKTFLKLPDKKRLHILNAAAEIFAREGYHNASVSDICENAGISNGALYKYFKNKEDLFLTLIDYGIDLVRGLYGQVETDKSVIATLNSLFKGIHEMARDMGFIISMYLDLGTCALNSFADKKSAKLERIGRDFLTELLTGAASRGEISKTVDIPSTVYFIDNLIILYSYSMVSVHYKKRLLTFMNEKKDVPEKKKIAFMLGAVSRMLEADIK